MDSTHESQSDGQRLQYHVARGETPIGQYSIQEILSQVERQELDPFDHVYDEEKRDWIAIATHPAFLQESEFWERLKKKFVDETAHAAKAPVSLENEWFVLKGDHRFGPFEFLELVRLTQDKGLRDWDYVWNRSLPQWVQMSTLPQFQTEAIQNLRNELKDKLGGTLNEVFFRRRYARASFEESILVHNYKKLFKGKSHELGAGGVSVTIVEGDLKIGERVHLHIKPSKETPAFNSSCEVMSRRVVHAGDSSSPIVYGMKFLNLDTSIQSQIDNWATQKSNTKNGKAAS
jgi:hypothetical protein